MNKSKYNNMFKVSPYKRKFLNTKTGILTENDFHEICKYDIHDFATYDLDGNFIKDAEQIEYNTCFLILLSDLNILEVKDFFNYHYDYTPNKETYLDYLEFGILNDKSIYLGIKELCKKLINDKRKINEQLIYENKIAVQILGYGKQNINPKNQTVLNYITDLLIENDLKPIDAIKILNKSTSNFSPEFKDAHFQNIINYLESLIRYNEPQQSNILPLNTDKNESKEPINPFKKIFINGFSYELFERLRDEIIENPKHNYANYSFIICQMINDEFLHETNHVKLIKFLDQNYKTTIGIKYNQFKFADTDKKKRVYSKLKKEFKPKINSIL